MHYIYILESGLDSTYYVGYTDDFSRRLMEHNSSPHDTFSSKHRPWILKAVFEVVGSKGDAMRAERFIKRQKSRKFIEAIISKDKVDLHIVQLVRVPKLRD